MRRSIKPVVVCVALLALVAASCASAALREGPSPGATPLSPSPGQDLAPSTASPSPSTPTATPSPMPYATPTAVPVPTWVPQDSGERIVVTPGSAAAPEGQRVGETLHFAFYTPDGTFPPAVPNMPEQAEIIFADVSARLGFTARQKTRVTFRPPSPLSCPPRGLAGTRPPRIFIYADDETSRDQILGVMAHELGHILIMTRFEAIPRALNEGLATWASAPYFNRWLGNPSLEAAVRAALRDGAYLPLHQNYHLTDINPGTEEGSSESCIARRETLYIEWASFLGYLIERRGMHRLEALIRTVPEPEMTDAGLAFKPADFEAVYGSSLNQLEAAWLRHILGQRRSAAARIESDLSLPFPAGL